MHTTDQGTPVAPVLPIHGSRAKAAATELGYLAQAAADAPIVQTSTLTVEVAEVVAGLSPAELVQAATLLVEQLRDQVIMTHFYMANSPATPF